MPIRVAVWAVIVRDEQLLLVEFNDPSEIQAWHFNLPGGGVEPGETLHEAIQREVREEAGVEVDVGELLFVWDYIPPPDLVEVSRPHVRPVFRCTLRPDQEPSFPPTHDPHQIGVRWVPFAELDTLPLIPPISLQILDALRRPNPRDPYVVDKPRA